MTFSKHSQEAILARRGAARRKGGRRKDHVQFVGHLGALLHFPRVGHLAQCYCFLSILYNWANATGGEEGRRL